jgi:REP element-mobilizing transposase RayT
MTKYNPDIHHRRSIRLRDYDYAQAGLYFITICVQNHECLFGKIMDGKMWTNEFGVIIENEWLKTSELRKNIQLHEFVIMPNHFHGIIEIINNNNNCDVPCTDVVTANACRGVARNAPTTRNAPTNDDTPTNQIDKNEYMASISPKSNTLSTIVRAFKSAVTKQIHEMGFHGTIWQRNYYENIIRDHNAYGNIVEYIQNNPAHWEQDKFYTELK